MTWVLIAKFLALAPLPGSLCRDTSLGWPIQIIPTYRLMRHNWATDTSTLHQ
jgi:hypothetical protein